MALLLFVLMMLMLNEEELREKIKTCGICFLFFFLFLFCFNIGQVTFPNRGANERGIVLLDQTRSLLTSHVVCYDSK